METLKALEWRYATKKFDANKKVEDKKIKRITEAFNLTPTSYGLQPIKLIVVRNQVIKQRLLPHSYNQNQVVDASHLLVFCIEDIIDKNFVLNNFDLIKSVRNTPEDILAPFRNFLVDHFSKLSQGEVKKWATNQAYLAMGNVLTICALEEIDACPMEGFIPEKYSEILQLQKHNLTPVLVLPVGYRAHNDEFSSMKKVRRPLEETIIEID